MNMKVNVFQKNFLGLKALRESEVGGEVLGKL
jgi:hypothetical protein